MLVNNAGGSPPADSATASPKFSTSIIKLNLIAPLVFSQRANAVMQQQDDGRRHHQHRERERHPAVARHRGVRRGQGRAHEPDPDPRGRLRAQGARRLRHRRATCAPSSRDLFYGDEAGIAAVGATIPLGRMADPADIGDVCVFLASPIARYIDGTSVLVDGGGERPAYLDASTADELPPLSAEATRSDRRPAPEGEALGVLAADGDDLAGHVGRVVAGEEHDHVRDLPRLGGAAERLALGQLVEQLVGVTLARNGCIARLGATAFTRTPAGAPRSPRSG